MLQKLYTKKKNLITTLRYLLSGYMLSEYMLNIIIHSDTFGKDNLTDMTCQGINKSSQTNLGT